MTTETPKTIEVGDVIFVIRKPHAQWLSDTYNGEVIAVDEAAIRITLVDWIVGTACGEDVYLRKEDIGMMCMYGKDHDKTQFMKDVLRWEETAKERFKSI